MLAAFAPVATAQLQFGELGKSHLPAHSDDTRGVVLADLDGDGDADLVFVNDGQSRLYFNDGAGIFTDATAGRLPIGSAGATCVATGDVDGDGDRDLVLGFGYSTSRPTNPQNRLYLNDGSGAFTDSTSGRLRSFTDDTQGVALGDVDGDGDLDVVFANRSRNRLHLNDGAGTFRNVTPSALPFILQDSRAVTLGDVDGDGDPDMVFGNSGQQNELYLNDGLGKFMNVSETMMPAHRDFTNDLVLGDLDGDGDQDLVVGNALIRTHRNRIYLNDGTGRFVYRSARMPRDTDTTRVVLTLDVDGDGDLDLLFGNGGSTQNRLLVNDGRGFFTDATSTRMPANENSTFAMVAGDADGDGDPDFVSGNHQDSSGPRVGRTNSLYFNDGTGAFADATRPRVPQNGAPSGSSVELGDVDGDGDLDLVVAGGGGAGAQDQLYINDGSGFFVDGTLTRMPGGGTPASSVALGDVDGDADLDLVLGSAVEDRLYLNDGSGTFVDVTAAQMPSSTCWTNSVLLVDVDGDADLDLVLACNRRNQLYRNDGRGFFTDVTSQRMPAVVSVTNEIVDGDFDGDGDCDLFAANNGQNRVYLNEGTGTFTDVTAASLPLRVYSPCQPGFAPSPGCGYSLSVVAADLDGDGDCDVVVDGGFGAELLLNSGSGIFVDSTAGRLVASTGSIAIAAADVDEDGDLDLVMAKTFVLGGISVPTTLCGNSLFLNDGAAVFADVTATHVPANSNCPRDVTVGDVDEDGDADIVFGIGASLGKVLYINLLRQLDAPLVAVTGRQYRLEAYARTGSSAQSIAVPFLSTRAARIPLPPLGTLGLDPTVLVALPPFVVPQPAGVGGVSIVVPDNPSLVGANVLGQGVLLQGGSLARLTSVTRDTIGR